MENKYVPKPRKDLKGKKFGRLSVLEMDIEASINSLEKKGKRSIYWICSCDCGVTKTILGENLTSGNTMSCGCYNKEQSVKTIKKANKKHNIYEFGEEFGVVFATNTGKEFYFDLEDYDKIKQYTWSEDNRGYARTSLQENGNRQTIKLHKLITDTNNLQIVDHINQNKADNRKQNLRITTQQQNVLNSPKQSNNTSGIIGVSFRTNCSKWVASITYNKEKYYLGAYIEKEDAIIARLNAEIKYFGYENSQQKHLFEKYSIKYN